MLQHRNPAAGEISTEGVFGHILKVELGKSLVGLRQCGSQKRLHTHPGVTRNRRGRAIAFELHKRR